MCDLAESAFWGEQERFEREVKVFSCLSRHFMDVEPNNCELIREISQRIELYYIELL